MVSVGLVNFPIKFDTKFVQTLQTDMNRLLETDIQAPAVTTPDAAILWHDRPYIQYKQIKLENFCQYLGIIM